MLEAGQVEVLISAVSSRQEPRPLILAILLRLLRTDPGLGKRSAERTESSQLPQSRADNQDSEERAVPGALSVPYKRVEIPVLVMLSAAGHGPEKLGLGRGSPSLLVNFNPQ